MTYGIYDGAKIIARFTAPLTLRSNVPVFASDTLSLKRNTQSRPAQRWELETGVEPLSYGAQELYVHLVTKGTTEIFTIIVPQNYGVIRARTSVANITGTGSVDSTSITIANNAGLIPMGTAIKFSNHGKVYITTANFSSASGTLPIFPGLRTAVSGHTIYHRDNVQMNVSYDLDTVAGMTYSDGILMNIGTIKLIERL